MTQDPDDVAIDTLLEEIRTDVKTLRTDLLNYFERVKKVLIGSV